MILNWKRICSIVKFQLVHIKFGVNIVFSIDVIKCLNFLEVITDIVK